MPQRRHAVGFSGTTSVHCSTGINGRSYLAWPDWPPGFRLDFGLAGIGLACAWSELGGSEELRGVFLKRASCSASRASRSPILARNARIIACAFGVCRQMTSSLTRASRDMPQTSPKTPIKERPISPQGVNVYPLLGFPAQVGMLVSRTHQPRVLGGEAGSRPRCVPCRIRHG